MRSANVLYFRLGFATLKRSPHKKSTTPPYSFSSTARLPYYNIKFLRLRSSADPCRTRSRGNGCVLQRRLVSTAAMDEDPIVFSSFDQFDDQDVSFGGNPYPVSSSEGEESDSELLINHSSDVDLPRKSDRVDRANATSTLTDHGLVGYRRRKRRIGQGVLNNIGLVVFMVVLLLFVDWCSWRIVRLPLKPFFLTYPFSASAVLASFAGFLYVPLFKSLKINQIIRKEGPSMHSYKRGTPTMGGLFFIPVGVTVARAITGFSSIEVHGVAAATLAFAAIGLLDDILSLLKNHNYGLPAWLKFLLQVVAGTWFSFWLDSANISSPYSMKMLVPLPAPLGLLHLGKFYLFFTAFCFASMSNGVNLTDGLDGLAGGISALTFIGMSVAVLPISSDLSIFGASMAGACIGFLMHNRYKASVFMGDTGSLALGGALAAMAACTGMFFPLFISSFVFVVEVLSVIAQVFFFKATRCFCGSGRRLFRMAPLHHHLELCGLKEPIIVAIAYAVSCILAVYAGYVGLISA